MPNYDPNGLGRMTYGASKLLLSIALMIWGAGGIVKAYRGWRTGRMKPDGQDKDASGRP